jgi:hypothetical protein
MSILPIRFATSASPRHAHRDIRITPQQILIAVGKRKLDHNLRLLLAPKTFR